MTVAAAPVARARPRRWRGLASRLALVLLVLAACGAPGGRAIPRAAPTELRCDLVRGPGPVLVGSATPRFGWRLKAGERQTAYQLRVTSSARAPGTGDLWDSGVVVASASTGLVYAGQALTPGQHASWRVRTWDEAGQASTWSQDQVFEVAAALPGPLARLALISASGSPVATVRAAPERLFAAFPSAAYGTLALDFSSPGKPGALDVRLGERRTGDAVWRPGDDDLPAEIAVVSHATQVWWDGTQGTITVALPAVAVPGAAPLPAGLDGVVPFRYAEVTGAPAALDHLRMRQVAVSYPFAPDASAFRSSDPGLDEVWELSRRTIQATSAFGIYVDGTRERLPYEADALIDQLGHYAVDADYAMARFTADHLLDHPTWPTEWILQDLLIAWNDWLYTGDDALVRARYDDLARHTLVALERDDGLISTQTGLVTPALVTALHLDEPPSDIVDWPPAERADYEFLPVNTVVNVFHGRALEIMANLAEVAGRPADAAKYRARAERTRSAILTLLFDPARGLFVDGEGSDHASFHANLFALALGFAPDDRVGGIVEFLSARGMGCSVYGAQFLLEGLYRAGAGQHALALLTSQGTRSWRHMIHDLDATLTHEAWDPSIKPNEDFNHAWGAAPANVIPRCLMGVQPLTPGFASFVVAPQLGGLAWAELRHPTVRGPIVVRVENEGGRRARVTLQVPAAADAYVRAPCLADEAAIVDGAAWPTASERTVGPLGPGEHEVACR